MQKVLGAISVFVALCLFVAVWTLKDFDKNIRLAVIEQVAEKTGRSVVIDGEVKNRFSFSPSVEINDIKLTNASWGKNPYMAQIGKLEIKIDPLPLFQRKVKIERLSLKNVSLNFEVDSKGQKNWIFLSNKQDSEKQNKNESSQKNEKKYRIITEQAVVEDIRFSLDDEQKEKTMKFQVASLNINASNGKFDFDTRFTVENKPFDLKMETETQNDSLSQYAFLMNLKGEGVEAKAKGTVLQPLSDIKLNAEVEAKITQLSFFNAFTGYSLPELQDTAVRANIDFSQNGGLSFPNIQIVTGNPSAFFAQINGNVASVKPLSARFETKIQAQNMATVQGLPSLPATKVAGIVEINQGILLDALDVTVGESDLSGRIFMQTEPNVSLQVQLQSEQLNLGDVLWKNYQSFKTGAEKLPQTIAQSEANQEFPFEKLQAANAEISVDIKNMIALEGTKLGSFSLKAAMKDGVFYLPLTKLADLAQIQANFDASKRPANGRAVINVNKMPLTLFFGQDTLKRGMMTGNVQLIGNGSSKKEMYSSLNGRVFVNAQDVYFNSFRLIEVPENISILSMLNNKQSLSVPCAVINVPIENGLISSQKKIGMESNLFNLQISGDINLADEKLNLKLMYSPQEGDISKIMFSELLIRGPFRKPVLEINKEKAFDRALSVGLAFFTGGKKAAQETMNRQTLKNVCADAKVGQ